MLKHSDVVSRDKRDPGKRPWVEGDSVIEYELQALQHTMLNYARYSSIATQVDAHKELEDIISTLVSSTLCPATSPSKKVAGAFAAA